MEVPRPLSRLHRQSQVPTDSVTRHLRDVGTGWATSSLVHTPFLKGEKKVSKPYFSLHCATRRRLPHFASNQGLQVGIGSGQSVRASYFVNNNRCNTPKPVVADNTAIFNRLRKISALKSSYGEYFSPRSGLHKQ